MAEVSKHAPGAFCWAELGTTDSAGAKKFYSGLLGWTALDNPVGPDMVYTMLQIRGKNVGALYQMGKDQKGMPPCWSSYVTVANADQSAQRAKDLGATLMMEPFDVMDVGRMAVIQDPTGAVFSIWQPKKHIGAELVGEPGTSCWNELATRDAMRAEKFYTGLFGWGTHKMMTGADGKLEYTVFKNGESFAGGMMQMTAEWGEVPPHWLVYFAVSDCDKSADKAKSLGGKIIHPPTDIPNTGRFSVLQDPQGAVFAVIKLLNA